MADGFITIKLQVANREALREISNTEKYGKKAMGAIGTAAKAAAAMAVASFAAVSKVAKDALDSYASYEQLAGGVDKLYQQSADKVKQYAADAYKTVGMSQNQYMETATQFSASLISSLGGDTAKAAEQTQKAMEVMADNANVFGTNMEDVTNAVKGFSKQNYTMLDNLKLGYGGTKTEMERLLADAEAISGQSYDISSMSDIIDALEVIQTKQHITGTTAKEAAKTIEGSVNSAKAAYQNWLVSLGDENADLKLSTDQLIDSIATAAENIVPRMGEILSGLWGAIGDKLPEMLSKVGDDLTSEDVVGFMQGMMDALGQVDLAEIITQLSLIMETVLDGFISWIKEPETINTIGQGLYDLIMACSDFIIRARTTIFNGVFGTYSDNAQVNSVGVGSSAQITEKGTGNRAIINGAHGRIVDANGKTIRAWASGGIFKSATMLGGRNIVGEAGPEAVLPLNQNTLGQIGQGISQSGGMSIDYDRMANAFARVMANTPIRASVSANEIDYSIGARQLRAARGL